MVDAVSSSFLRLTLLPEPQTYISVVTKICEKSDRKARADRDRMTRKGS